MRRKALSKKSTQTRAGELRDVLEEEIATGRITPGTRLDEMELSHRFNVSRTPIREALMQLASVGIVEARPRRGAIIPQLTPQRMTGMFEVMAELEAMCGRLAARRMSAAEHQVLLAAHQACGVPLTRRRKSGSGRSKLDGSAAPLADISRA